VPALRGEATLEDNDVFVEWNSEDGRPKPPFPTEIPTEEIARVSGLPWRTVVTADGWKLNLSPGDQCELYDLNGDPYEQRNLFDDPGQAGRIRDLAARIRGWQARTDDDTTLPDLRAR
jgi:arylsulfatase A-like enzyme